MYGSVVNKRRRAQQPAQERCRRQVALLAVSTLFVLAAGLWAGATTWRWGVRFRLVEVESFQEVLAPSVGAYSDYVAQLDQQGIGSINNPNDRYLALLSWTMSQVRSVDAYRGPRDPESLLMAVQSGSGALCDNMCSIYLAAAGASDSPARVVWLFKDLFSGDTHSVVEVLRDGKWVLLDPTFGVSYQDRRGAWLSAQDIKERLFKGEYRAVNAVYVAGDVSYPPRLGEYYMNFLPLFNNVFVVGKRPSSVMAMLPPFRYWFGTKLYYELLPGESARHIALAQHLYFVAVVVLPAMFGLLVMACAWRGLVLMRLRPADDG
jgi:hypothetical protein